MDFFSERETTDNAMDGGGVSLCTKPLVHEEGLKQHQILYPLTHGAGDGWLKRKAVIG
jgi:hypothetical protein